MIMKALANKVGQAVDKLEKEILPKSKQPPFEIKDGDYLSQRLAELRRIHDQALQAPVFSIRFLGDTQNGKSTLINSLLGKKVLPEGHVGACSATIVRCQYREQPKITVHFRYCSEIQFKADLASKIQDAEVAVAEEESAAGKKETACNLLGRFLRLLEIDHAQIANPSDLIELCRRRGMDFPERKLLGTDEKLEATPENEQRIHENLSARGRRANRPTKVFHVGRCH
jgi:Dynamin family